MVSAASGSAVAAPTATIAAPTIEEFPRSLHVRSPSDVVRLTAALLLMVISYVIAAAYRDRVAELQAGVLDTVSALPSGVRGALVGITQLAAVAAPALVAIVLLVRRSYRLLLGMLAAAIVASVLMKVAGTLALDNTHPPSWDLEERTESWIAQTSFPSAEYLAGLAGVVTVAGGWMSRSWRRGLWNVVFWVVLVRVGTSGIPALDLVFCITAGIAAGAAVLAAIGGPNRSPRGVDIVDALVATGLPVTVLRQIPNRKTATLEYRASRADGADLHVTVRDQEDRERDLIYRLYCVIRFRGLGGERNVFTSLRQDAEHEAFMSMWAARAGVRVPEVRALRSIDSGSIMTASEWISGARLNELDDSAMTDEVLGSFWESVGIMHSHQIDHRRLRADNVVVDRNGAVWFTGLQDAEVDGPPAHREQDTAEALVSIALVSGPDRAVSTAISTIGSDAMAETLPQLQPLALTRETQHLLRHERSLLKELRTRVSEKTNTKAVELEQLERVPPKKILTVIAAFVAMWILLPTLANIGDTIDAFKSMEPGYILAMVPLTLLLYVFSTLQLMGACAQHLPFGSTYRCQMAAAFMNRVTPSNVGGITINARYLQRSGITPSAAAAAVGVSTFVDQILTVVLVLIFVVWAGRGTNSFSFSFADASTVLTIVTIVFVAIGLVMLTTRGRKILREKVVPFLRGVRRSFADVAKSPTRLLLIFGGSLGHTATDFLALVVALAAFGPLPAIGSLGAVYFGASVVGSASPTPGGLGAIEAAMIAGLTGLGIDIAVATPAVLIYRLITYWAVMVPGWISLEIMKKHGEV